MHELIEQIRKALVELDQGQLDLDGVDRTTEQARSLYERLVVLRHKAREVRVVPPAPPMAAPLPPPPPVEMPPMRLDTRPSEAAPRQTSLIDAIAESETPPAPLPSVSATPKPIVARAEKTAEHAAPKKAPDAPKPAAKTASLADKLEKGPVPDLHKAIALSQKFWFVAELFQGQRERYEKSIDKLNSLASVEEAKAFVDKEIVGQLGKAPDADALRSFLELIERRYL